MHSCGGTNALGRIVTVTLCSVVVMDMWTFTIRDARLFWHPLLRYRGLHIKEYLTSSGHLYSAGTYILQGYYYELKKTNRKGSFYKQSFDSKTTIPVECVLYVGIDMVKNSELSI